ncbi:hypothetical protein [Streptomyces sp. NPDC053048]|uniref:hypothetical protein n=1 Tax=Streptomyces sp. NPDC053048 TaxID=3365694 RepID=UPI0037D7F355
MATIKEARAENRLRHAQQRQAEQAARGPKGVAAAWWDTARSICVKRAAAGDEEAWHELTRFLQNFCARYPQ